MREDEFLPKDITRAIAEIRSAWSCISMVEEKLIKGDLKEAKLTVCDLLNSLHELEKMREKKLHQDQLIEVVEKLANQGILIDLVSFRRR